MSELRRELRPALKDLQVTNIAPVDMAQCAIGPGMAVYSRYSSVVNTNGRAMTVREALQIINTELDAYFNDQDGEADSGTAFCIAVYEQYGYGSMPYGDANTLATAKNTTPDALEERGAIESGRGRLRLLRRDEMTEDVGDGSLIWMLAQQFTRAMEDAASLAARSCCATSRTTCRTRMRRPRTRVLAHIAFIR